jgi:hypothetical protein
LFASDRHAPHSEGRHVPTRSVGTRGITELSSKPFVPLSLDRAWAGSRSGRVARLVGRTSIRPPLLTVDGAREGMNAEAHVPSSTHSQIRRTNRRNRLPQTECETENLSESGLPAQRTPVRPDASGVRSERNSPATSIVTLNGFRIALNDSMQFPD